jgi:hypothetical protein
LNWLPFWRRPRPSCARCAPSIAPRYSAVWGWDLSTWTYNVQRGIVFFIHHDTAGEATDVVIAVNAPEGERAAFDPVLGRMSLPARLVCVAGDVRR